MFVVVVLFFFFQAEDGIRDYKVTGVQTCALPISCRLARSYRAFKVPGRMREPCRRAARAGRQDGGMRAIVVRQHGRPEVLQIAELPDPRPGPGQLLVDVAAAGVNFMDIYQRQGNPPYASDLPYVPGAEGAGTVAGVGPDVQGFADGDRVAWTGVPGSYAERVVLPAGSAVPVPDGLDLQVAAAVML